MEYKDINEYAHIGGHYIELVAELFDVMQEYKKYYAKETLNEDDRNNLIRITKRNDEILAELILDRKLMNFSEAFINQYQLLRFPNIDEDDIENEFGEN